MNKITHIAALVAGLLMGVGLSSMWPFGGHTDNMSKTTTQTVNVSEKQIKTDTITEKRVLPDGTRVETKVTSTTRNEQEKQKVKEKTEHKQGDDKATTSKWSLGLSFVPKDGDWMDMRSYTLSGVEIGRRIGSLPLWGSPALWGEVGYGLRDGQFTLGVRIEL